jgi:hypothetical protein
MTQQTDSEDNAILQVARELCYQLAVNFGLNGVTWTGNFGLLMNLPSDHAAFIIKGPRRGFLVLPIALKEKLAPAEWKSVIASSVLHQFRSEFRRVYMISYRFWQFLVVLSGALIAASFIIRNPLLGLIFIPVYPIAWIGYPRAHNFYVIRSSWLRADTQTARIFGKEQLVQILEKIDSMHILDLEEGKIQKQTMWKRKVYPLANHH